MKLLENTHSFIIETLKLHLFQCEKEPEDFDENKPVLEVMGEWNEGELKLKKCLLFWSLQQAIKVDPGEHLNQSVKEMAEILSKRKRLGEDEYMAYRKEVYEQLRVLEEKLEDAEPGMEEIDKKEYLTSNN